MGNPIQNALIQKWTGQGLYANPVANAKRSDIKNKTRKTNNRDSGSGVEKCPMVADDDGHCD